MTIKTTIILILQLMLLLSLVLQLLLSIIIITTRITLTTLINNKNDNYNINKIIKEYQNNNKQVSKASHKHLTPKYEQNVHKKKQT